METLASTMFKDLKSKETHRLRIMLPEHWTMSRSFYFTHLVTFYEDELLPFFKDDLIAFGYTEPTLQE